MNTEGKHIGNMTHHFPGLNRQKDLLLHVVEGINRTFELKKLLAKSMESAKTVMQAEASSLMLLDQTNGNLSVSIPTGPVKEEVLGKKIPKDKGVGGWVITQNKPFISNNVEETDIFWKDLSEDFNTRNIICVPLRDEEDQAIGVLQALNKKKNRDFTKSDLQIFELLALHISYALERSRKYDDLKNRAQDRETQLSEIHHRLKNNISAISALIEFDMEDVQDEKSREILTSTNSRLRSVAHAHSLLYEQDNTGKIELSGYLEHIIQNVKHVFSTDDRDIVITNRLEALKLDAKRAMLCGLILNELLINAYKHAFVGRSYGEILITLKLDPDANVLLIVSDDGVGLNDNSRENKDSDNRKGGLGGHVIIESLAKQLDAGLKFAANPEIGSTCIVRFPFEA